MATKEQAKLIRLVGEMGNFHARRHGITRRQFLRTSSGPAMVFLAVNTIHGPFYLGGCRGNHRQRSNPSELLTVDFLKFC